MIKELNLEELREEIVSLFLFETHRTIHKNVPQLLEWISDRIELKKFSYKISDAGSCLYINFSSWSKSWDCSLADGELNINGNIIEYDE